MKKLLLLFALLLVCQFSFAQTPYNATQMRFNMIKAIYQPYIIQLPDSAIVYPLTGLTNIRVIPGNDMCAKHTEIELWIIDHDGKIIYNNTIVTTTNNGYHPVETDYCRYMKLQSNYLRIQRHIRESIALK